MTGHEKAPRVLPLRHTHFTRGGRGRQLGASIMYAFGGGGEGGAGREGVQGGREGGKGFGEGREGEKRGAGMGKGRKEK